MSVIRLLPAGFHAVADYAVAALLIVLPLLVGGSKWAVMTGVIVGIVVALVSALTRYPLGVVKVLPFTVHSAGDYLAVILLAAAPFALGFTTTDHGLAIFYEAAGLAVLVVSLVTDYQYNPKPAAAAVAQQGAFQPGFAGPVPQQGVQLLPPAQGQQQFQPGAQYQPQAPVQQPGAQYQPQAPVQQPGAQYQPPAPVQQPQPQQTVTAYQAPVQPQQAYQPAPAPAPTADDYETAPNQPAQPVNGASAAPQLTAYQAPAYQPAPAAPANGHGPAVPDGTPEQLAAHVTEAAWAEQERLRLETARAEQDRLAREVAWAEQERASLAEQERLAREAAAVEQRRLDWKAAWAKKAELDEQVARAREAYQAALAQQAAAHHAPAASHDEPARQPESVR